MTFCKQVEGTRLQQKDAYGCPALLLVSILCSNYVRLQTVVKMLYIHRLLSVVEFALFLPVSIVICRHLLAILPKVGTRYVYFVYNVLVFLPDNTLTSLLFHAQITQTCILLFQVTSFFSTTRINFLSPLCCCRAHCHHPFCFIIWFQNILVTRFKP